MVCNYRVISRRLKYYCDLHERPPSNIVDWAFVIFHYRDDNRNEFERIQFFIFFFQIKPTRAKIVYLRPPRISCTASFYIRISTVIIPFILTVHKPNSLNFIRLRNYCVTRRGGGPRLYEFISLGKQLTGHFRYCTFEQPKNRRKLLI